MNTTAAKDNRFNSFFPRIRMRRGLLFGTIIVTALLAFEFFNYSTTVFALRDLMGELKFLGIEWAIILAIAFCGIDFAGIARLFTPEAGANEPNEVWYLFAAWMLAATMNAMLTWWGVSIAILNQPVPGHCRCLKRDAPQGSSNLCGYHGVVDPGPDHRHHLGCRGPPVQPGRSANIHRSAECHSCSHTRVFCFTTCGKAPGYCQRLQALPETEFEPRKRLCHV